MAPSEEHMQQVRNDAKIAQELQQAEEGQAGAAVVRGIPLGAAGPVILRAADGDLPNDGAAGVAIFPNELLVRRYRCSLMCFATIDVIFTFLNFATGMVHAYRLKELYGGKVYSEFLAAGLGLVFLAGPLCGLIGAQRLNRGLVAVYLAFCLVKTVFELTLAIVVSFFWYLIVALVQLWITKIVFTFWRALGSLSQEQKAQLLSAARGANAAGMAYW